MGTSVLFTVFVQMLNDMSNWTDQFEIGCIDAESFTFANMMFLYTTAKMETLEGCGVPRKPEQPTSARSPDEHEGSEVPRIPCLPHGPLQTCPICSDSPGDPRCVCYLQGDAKKMH